MFQIIIVPNNSDANTVLSFKTKEAYEMARKNIHERIKVGVNTIVQEDDAGQTVEIPAEHLSYCMYLDVQKQQEFKLAMTPTVTKPQAPRSLDEEMVA